MFRELLRSTLYSSRRPPSSKATRVSSFSTLRTSLLPVFREGRPKIFLTLSIIKMEGLTGHQPSCRYKLQEQFRPKVHLVVVRWFRLGGGGGGAGWRFIPKSR